MSLWHISKLSILWLFLHFLKYFFTYSHNESSCNPEKWEKFKALVHFDWNIDSFQFSCHCDISVNCPLYAFFDTFWNNFWLTLTIRLLSYQKMEYIQSLYAFRLKYWLFLNFVSLWRFWQIMLYGRKNSVSQFKSSFPNVKFIQL